VRVATELSPMCPDARGWRAAAELSPMCPDTGVSGSQRRNCYPCARTPRGRRAAAELSPMCPDTRVFVGTRFGGAGRGACERGVCIPVCEHVAEGRVSTRRRRVRTEGVQFRFVAWSRRRLVAGLRRPGSALSGRGSFRFGDRARGVGLGCNCVRSLRRCGSAGWASSVGR
jgi:hypothetical protein